MEIKEIYEQLKDIAEKLNIRVTEENLKKTGPRVKSGFCIVKEQKKFIMDKHAAISKKAETLASFVAGMSLDSIFIVPAVRRYIDQYNVSDTDEMREND